MYLMINECVPLQSFLEKCLYTQYDGDKLVGGHEYCALPDNSEFMRVSDQIGGDKC